MITLCAIFQPRQVTMLLQTRSAITGMYWVTWPCNTHQFNAVYSTLVTQGGLGDHTPGLLVDFRSLSQIIQPLALSVCLISAIE